MASRFWVGNGGNWTDTAHWSTVSGGSSGASVPNSTDDAFFDANSFSSANQTVSLLSGSCQNLNFTGVTNNPRPSGLLYINRDLVLTSNVNTSFNYPAFYFVGNATMNLTTGGATVYGLLGVDSSGGGSLVLQDHLIMDGSSHIYIGGGTFNANNKNVTVGYFFGEEATANSTITMGSGTWTISASWQLFERSGRTLTLNGNTSTLRLEFPAGGGSGIDFIHSVLHSLTYHNIQVVGSGAGNDGITFQVNYDSPGYNLTCNNFTISGQPIAVSLIPGNTFTVNGIFTANGSVGNLTTLTSAFFSIGVVTAEVSNGGTGYVVNDVISILESGQDNGATLKVLTVSGGVVTSIQVTGFGDGYTTGVKTTSGGSGTSLTVNVTSIQAAAFFVVNSASTSYIEVGDNYASGAGTPITVSPGYPLGNTSGWYFPVLELSVFDTVTVFENTYTATRTFVGEGIERLGWSNESNPSFTYRGASLQLVMSSTEVVNKVTVHLGRAGTVTDNIKLAVYEGGSNPEDGTRLQTFFVLGSTIPSAFSVDSMTDVEFDFSTMPLTLTSGNTYYFTVTRSGPLASTYYYFSPTSGDTAANATLYKKNSSDVWAAWGSGKEMGFTTQIFSPAIVVETDPVTQFNISVWDTVLPLDAVSPPDKLVSKSDIVTVTENIQITPPFDTVVIWYISVVDTITATDVVSGMLLRQPDNGPRYWVGGSGNWGDNAHWANTSGGAPGAAPPYGVFQSGFSGPSSAENIVYFDANSFLSDGQVVNLDVDTIIATLDCTGMAFTATLTSLSGNHVLMLLNIGTPTTRSLVLHSKLTINSSITWTGYISGSNILNFNPNGIDLTGFTGNIGASVPGNFAGEGSTPTLNLTGDLYAPDASFGFRGSISGSSFSGYLSHFNTNDYTITVDTLYMGGSSGQPPSSMTMDCGTSTFNINSFSTSDIGFEGFYNEVLGTDAIWNITGPGTIWITLAAVIFGSGIQFGTVNFYPGTGTINVGYEYFNAVSLTVAAGTTFKFSHQLAVTITNAFTALGTSGNQIIFDGTGAPGYYGNTGGIPSTLTVGSASASYVTVSNSTVAGAGSPIYDIPGGINGGNNINWIFPSDIIVYDVVFVDDNFVETPALAFVISVSEAITLTENFSDRVYSPHRTEIDAPLKSINGVLFPVASD